MSDCEFSYMGEKCGKVGIVSPGTLGSGPWYCREHAWVSIGGQDRKPDQLPDTSVKTLQANARESCGRKGLDTVAQMRAWFRNEMPNIGKSDDGLGWARKILSKLEKGEKISLGSEIYAKEALGLKLESEQREPGEDA